MPVKPVTAQIEYKKFHFELKSVDEDQGIIEGYLSTFGNVDQGKDRVVKGAFKKTLMDAKSRMENKGKKLLWPVLWMHHEDQPLGKCLEASEDPRGLYVKFWLDITTNESGFPNNPLATTIFSGYKNGYVDEQSMGYKAIQKDYDSEGVRNLREVQVWELSCVTSLFAMNDEAVVTSVKSSTKGKAKMTGQIETKDFNDYYRLQAISDWADKWSSLTSALKSAVLDAFNVGDSPQEDVQAALDGGEGSPGFIAALIDWVNEGVELNVSNYMKPDPYDSQQSQRVGYTALGYMSRSDGLELKKGAMISKDSAARLSGHADTLELAHKAIMTVADDMRRYITGGQAPFNSDTGGDGAEEDGTNKDGPSSKSRQQRPRTAPQTNDQPLTSTDMEITDADLLAFLQSEVSR